MRYVSTRDSGHAVSSAEAILRGLAPDGGLYAPERLPQPGALWQTLLDKSYAQRAAAVMGLFLDDFPPEALAAF
ncbi:MAG: threonine synthase, partial [Oscillospiraceae bacterium]|nr:threonine synthase [Oscillospiraceae bacterium]